MELPKRKPIRFKGYDYSQNGLYFVTILSYKRQHIFAKNSSVRQGFYPCRINENDYSNCDLKTTMQLSEIGVIVQQEILDIEKRFNGVSITDYVVMPNHIHIVVWIKNKLNSWKAQNDNSSRQGQSPCLTGKVSQINTRALTLGDIIGSFKSISTKRVNALHNTPGRKIWHFRFHDRIIRNENEYELVSKYIYENPLKWDKDKYYNEV